MKKTFLMMCLLVLTVVLGTFSGQAMVLTSPDNLGGGGLQVEADFGYVPPQGGSTYTYTSAGPALKFGLTDRLDLAGELSYGMSSWGSRYVDVTVGANLAIIKGKYLVSSLQPAVTIDLVVPEGGSKTSTARIYSQTGIVMGGFLPYVGLGYDRVLSAGGTSWYGVDVGGKVNLGGLFLRTNLNYFFGYSTGSRPLFTITGALGYRF